MGLPAFSRFERCQSPAEITGTEKERKERKEGESWKKSGGGRSNDLYLRREPGWQIA